MNDNATDDQVAKYHTDFEHELREAIAAEVHRQWSQWMIYLFSKCSDENQFGLVIPNWAVRRWVRQMCTPYDSLSPEKEMDSDRIEADKYCKIIWRTVRKFDLNICDLREDPPATIV